MARGRLMLVNGLAVADRPEANLRATISRMSEFGMVQAPSHITPHFVLGLQAF